MRRKQGMFHVFVSGTEDFIRTLLETALIDVQPVDLIPHGKGDHTSVEYGPCMSDKDFGCEYKTRLKDYQVTRRGTKDERIIFSNKEAYQAKYFQWLHLENLREDVIREWHPPVAFVGRTLFEVLMFVSYYRRSS